MGLFISLGVIVFICLICSIFFYKCSRVMIENSNKRAQERRLRMALEALQTGNHLVENQNNPQRREDATELLKKENLKKLEYLFTHELHPVEYDNKVNEFENNCTICLEDFSINNQVIKLQCKHLFHYSCLKDWLVKQALHPKCPNCNYLVIEGHPDHVPGNVNGSTLLLNDNQSPERGNLPTEAESNVQLFARRRQGNNQVVQGRNNVDVSNFNIDQGNNSIIAPRIPNDPSVARNNFIANEMDSDQRLMRNEN
jgi:hypothetical protein